MILERGFVALREKSEGGFPLATPAFEHPRAALDQCTLTWVGHSTWLVQLAGLNILTDPMWSERAGFVRFLGPRRVVPPAIALNALPPIDVVVQSHSHYDHLDEPTVQALAAAHPDASWLAPLGLATWLRDRGVQHVQQLDWYDRARVGPLELLCTPAQHGSARSAFDRDRTLWCGWSLAAAGRRIFFCGDSGYHPDFARIGERGGPFDVALMPIGAYEPRWFMRPVHMNPEEAVRATRELAGGAGQDVPALVGMHWGTFRLTTEPMHEPPERARRAWKDAALPADRLWIFQHGETRTL